MSRNAPAPTPTKQTRVNPRRDLIISRAADAFGRHGFHATTLDDIAGQLGVTKASLYYYFSSKEDLLYAVLKMAMREHIDRVDRGLATHGGASAAKKIEVAIIEHMRLLASEYEGAFLLQQEYELNNDDHRAEILALRDEYQRRFVDIIREGVQSHCFRVRDERIVALMILGSINWFLRWYRSDGRFTVDEIARVFVDMILHGLLASPQARADPVPRRPARAFRRRRSGE